jgi:predicted glycosyltransferase
VVATQPGAEENRRALVRAIVAGLEERESQFALIIKTHPDERIELYDEFTSGRNRITLETDDLFEHLRRADLVVTINSNVGLEAMVLGTPLVCFNPWRPFVFEQTYALTGEVPVLRSEEDLTAYLRDLREQQLVGLRSEQELFVAENYRLTPSVSADIAAYIESH